MNPAEVTLAEAQAWLRARIDDGERCPCCTQRAQVYRRKINSGMARAFIQFYRAYGTDWGHKPTALKGLGAAARDESLLRYWDLWVEADEPREDGGRAGWWQVTERGEQFVLGYTRVPKYARIYDSRLLRFDTEEFVTIKDALGDRFDYDELMRGG